ncbi:hypothetical protein [Amnibacterium setariae]|uniref:Uncharacterized protein n=1 Tax=Amnibacterium setariae TaxID=2306585 RepID=A0A3A1U650_9MICO|nr:hypothetical protein [Amnibacterium setariae]RIX28414.1 hypothetical protein D1781_13350 [Amnibacterium setariae]
MSAIKRIALAISAALGLFVGGWATITPRGFYEAFPGVLGHWIDLDGPYNEHLIRDVGGLYLALAAASVVVLVLRSAWAPLGAAWTVFGALHLAYHATHLDGFSTADAVGAIVSLAVSLGLGVVLLVPTRRRAEAVTR